MDYVKECLKAAAEGEDVAKNLKAAREALGWTQKDLGEKLGCPVHNGKCRTVEAWEQGKRQPDRRYRRAILGLAEQIEDGS